MVSQVAMFPTTQFTVVQCSFSPSSLRVQWELSIHCPFSPCHARFCRTKSSYAITSASTGINSNTFIYRESTCMKDPVLKLLEEKQSVPPCYFQKHRSLNRAYLIVLTVCTSEVILLWGVGWMDSLRRFERTHFKIAWLTQNCVTSTKHSSQFL